MAKPGPKPSGRINEIKVLLDDRTYSALHVWIAANGISSNSDGGAQIIARFLLGAIGSVPMLNELVTPSPANSRPQLKEERPYGN